MDLLNWKIPYMDNTHSSWPSLILILLFRRKDIHGAVRPLQIFTTTKKKYWILFRIGPERGRKAGMPTGVCLFSNSPDPIVPILGTSSAKVTEWVSRQSLDYVMYFICWVTGAFYQRFRLYQSTLVWFLLNHILGGWRGADDFQTDSSFIR